MGFFDGAFGGIASGVGGIVSSIFGNKAQRDANQANIELSQMNNEWSERMMNKQMLYNTGVLNSQNRFAEKQAADANAFTEKMWNKTNDYNSAKNQAARLREAGLNPALVMSGQNAGSAAGASGVQAATPSGNSVGLPSPSSVSVHPLNYEGFGKAVESAFGLAAQLQRNSAETDWFRTQSAVMAAKAAEEVKNLKFKNKLNDITESMQVAMMNEDYLTKVQSRDMNDIQMSLMKQTRIMNDIQILNMPEQMKADISLKLAQAESATMSDIGRDLRFFEKKYNVRISREELRMLYEAWKKSVIFAPYKGMSATSAAASIGGVIGDKIKGLWK